MSSEKSRRTKNKSHNSPGMFFWLHMKHMPDSWRIMSWSRSILLPINTSHRSKQYSCSSVKDILLTCCWGAFSLSTPTQDKRPGAGWGSGVCACNIFQTFFSCVLQNRTKHFYYTTMGLCIDACECFLKTKFNNKIVWSRHVLQFIRWLMNLQIKCNGKLIISKMSAKIAF